MPTPNFQAVGAASTGATVSFPAWPTHQTGDIGLVVVETSGDTANLTLSVPSGWAEVPGSPVTDIANSTGSKLGIFWKRATSNAEQIPEISGANHCIGRLYTFRNCISTGNPWDVTTTGNKTTASTTATVPAVTTTVSDTLIVMIVGRPNDNSSTNHFGVPVNSNLTDLAERGEAGTTLGNGGGFVLSTGVKATAGNTGTSTLTKSVSTTDTYMVIAFKGEPTLTRYVLVT